MTTPTTVLHLTKSEAEDHTYTRGGQMYYVDKDRTLAVTPTDRWGKRYVDADERPGEIPPNGNGWTYKTREYDAAPVAPERVEEVRDHHDLTLMAQEYPDQLAALPRTERLDWLRAERASRKENGHGRPTRPAKVDGVWTAQALPTEPPAALPEDDDDRL